MEKEIIIAEDNKEGLPYIYAIGNKICIEKSSSPNDPRVQFLGLFQKIARITKEYTEIFVEINLGYFSTNTQFMLRDLFSKLSKTWFECRPYINWFYFEDDEDTYEYGKYFSELNPDIKFKYTEMDKPT